MEKIANLFKLKKRWEENLAEVIDFWATHSIDREHDGYFTCLAADGTVLDKTKYHWLQGRQVWTFSKLFNDDPTKLEMFDTAFIGYKFMHKAKAADGSLFFSTTQDGTHLHFQRKPYAAVFYAVGLLEFSRTIKNLPEGHEQKTRLNADEIYAEAELYFDKLRTWMADPTIIGGQAADKKTSKLGDVMCVTGLAVDFYATETDEAKRQKYLAIMENAGKTAKLHYSTTHRVFMEQALLTTGLDFSTPSGRLCNPGHSIEISWFLLHLNKYLDDEELKEMALEGLLGALDLGYDQVHGGITYMLDILNMPMMDTTVTAEHKLWWPMSEALYATVLAFEESQETIFYDWCVTLWSCIEEHFIDKKHGGDWFGYLRRDCSVYNKLKGGNYKGCFHVPRALIYSIDSANRIVNSSL